MPSKKNSRPLTDGQVFNTLEFKKLQADWYKKLKKDGQFQEIEDGPYLHTWSAFFKAKHSPESFQERQDYYLRAHQKLVVGRFETKFEKRIWQMHSEALGSRVIAANLKKLGYKKVSKDRVLKVINELKIRFKNEIKNT